MIVYHLGENKTITFAMDSKRYLYEYKRSFTSGSTRSTFSDNLNELIELCEKEKSMVL